MTKKQKKFVSMIKKIILILFLTLPFNIFSQDLTIVRDKSGKYGFADINGDTLIKCNYDYVENFSNGLALVKNNLYYKLIDTAGKLYDLELYTGGKNFRHNFGKNYSGLPVIIRQWDCFYITSGGKVFLNITYHDANSFVAGKAKVFAADKYNYISKRGILLDSWKPVEDNFHAIKYKDKYGYIDQNGKLVIDYSFVDAQDFNNGLAQISNGKFWALINKKGEKISDWYEQIDDFNGNIAIVKKFGNIGFINKKGKFMGQWYKSIKKLEFGMYRVEKYEKFAVINNNGFIVTQWFDEIFEFKNTYLKVRKETKYAYLNKIGALVVGWYDNIGTIENGIIRVEDEDKEGFFNVESFFISNFYDSMGEFVDDIAFVKQNEHYAYINKNGKLLTAFEYDLAKPFNGGIAEVQKDGKTTYINTDGKPIFDWYNKRNYFQKEPPKGIIAVKFGRKYGFQTINGSRVISAKYDYAENFNNGLALVKNNRQEMYFNKKGELVPTSEYPDNNDIRLDQGYKHNNAPIKAVKWDCSFIDYNGEVVIDLKKYDNAHSFSLGKAKVFKGDKYNYINTKGKLVDTWVELPDDYHPIEKDGKFGFIDKNGDLIIDYQFDFAYDFYKGTAKIRIGSRKTGKYGLINQKGDKTSKMYDQISSFENNLAVVKNNQKYSIINYNGKEIAQWYDEISDFSEKYARVKLNNKYSFINSHGLQLKTWFDDAGYFEQNRAKVLVNNKWGFINKKGDIITACEYDNVWNYKNNIAKVIKDEKYAFINLAGEVITQWFDRLYMFNDNRAVVCTNKKWGYINLNGEIAIPVIYDRAFAFENGEAIVIKDGIMIKIDKNGNTIE